MPRYLAIGLFMPLVCVACGAKTTSFNWAKYQPPGWHRYQARDVQADNQAAAGAERQGGNDRVTFHDLKNESDRGLATRLLGAVGQRISYIDRHKDRWRYYRSDDDAAESLYTHPDALGSQYGLCGVEKYSLSFDDAGRISSVSMTERYGVEGPIFQKPDYDWDYYYKVMCSSVPSSHAPSYFPAVDSITAQRVAMLLLPAIDLAASSAIIYLSEQPSCAIQRRNREARHERQSHQPHLPRRSQGAGAYRSLALA